MPAPPASAIAVDLTRNQSGTAAMAEAVSHMAARQPGRRYGPIMGEL